MKLIALLMICLFSLVLLIGMIIWCFAAYHWVAFYFGSYDQRGVFQNPWRADSDDLPAHVASHRRKALRAMAYFMVCFAIAFAIGLLGNWIYPWRLVAG